MVEMKETNHGNSSNKASALFLVFDPVITNLYCVDQVEANSLESFN